MQTTTETKTKKTPKAKPPTKKAKAKTTAKPKKEAKKKETTKETKVETKTPTVVTPVTAADRRDAEKRIDQAREHLLQMHKNWFLFAKQLKEIRDKNDAAVFKVESFRKLCEREFPTIDYTHISKMVVAVEKLGTEIERRLKNPNYLVPDSQSCYHLTTLKRVNPDGTVDMRVPEADYKKLEQELLDSGMGGKKARIGHMVIRQRIKEILERTKKKMREEITAETEKWADEEQRKLDQELKANGITDDEDDILDEDDFTDSVEEVDFEDVDEEVDETPVSTVSVESLASRVDFLIENVPPFVEGLSTIDGKTREFLKKVKKLQTILTETTEALSGN